MVLLSQIKEDNRSSWLRCNAFFSCDWSFSHSVDFYFFQRHVLADEESIFLINFFFIKWHSDDECLLFFSFAECNNVSCKFNQLFDIFCINLQLIKGVLSSVTNCFTIKPSFILFCKILNDFSLPI